MQFETFGIKQRTNSDSCLVSYLQKRVQSGCSMKIPAEVTKKPLKLSFKGFFNLSYLHSKTVLLTITFYLSQIRIWVTARNISLNRPIKELMKFRTSYIYNKNYNEHSQHT